MEPEIRKPISDTKLEKSADNFGTVQVEFYDINVICKFLSNPKDPEYKDINQEILNT